ncbi:vanadium-dependent haloperoxidase [Roseisolibacter agri]|uniref:PA-phosphatase n=1 Tax=Roseisolibacter agri TaxID=2014610 RepID=A0AA37QJB7_9BACT|nr:vanadium-dependent haloperoxidase [Roseisolibacter agri]GLC27555.1 PA-phosphatase [Roseisolibacter agri]
MTRSALVLRTLRGLLGAGLALAACADPPTTSRVSRAPAANRGTGSGPRADAALLSVAWEATARQLIASHPTFTPVTAVRVYALHALAQYGGLVAADFGGGTAQFEVRRGAIAGASAQLLAFVFPDAAAMLEAQLAAQAAGGDGRVHPQFARGVAIGRAMGDLMIAWARADGATTPWTGPPLPTGAGIWTPAPNSVPAGIQVPRTHPYFLTSASQFRPPPPPAFGTAAFDVEVARVLAVTQARTPAQAAIANLWNQGSGTETTPGFWLREAAELAVAAGLDERETAHLLALLGATMLDASVGCFDAKYFYLVLRPSQANPAITRPEGLPGFPYALPNHPSYPSGHMCLSGAAVTILSAYFPRSADMLAAQLQEAGLSRVYGGIHYFMDIAAGQTLGRQTALLALAYDDAYGLLTAVPGLGVSP